MRLCLRLTPRPKCIFLSNREGLRLASRRLSRARSTRFTRKSSMRHPTSWLSCFTQRYRTHQVIKSLIYNNRKRVRIRVVLIMFTYFKILICLMRPVSLNWKGLSRIPRLLERNTGRARCMNWTRSFGMSLPCFPSCVSFPYPGWLNWSA